ncbi:MAG: hypothetical protein FK734_13385 [Asgard group archaeon]|nr:hypothetical protein [Asgard group archaeon]
MSQIDIMITHLLTFEDDIKAFLKRVPSSVPEEFKESDFIRSMPTGIGLLSDQKTQDRSFIVKVRPRISLHAGREAIPASLRDRMRNHKQPYTPTLDKRDVLVETVVDETPTIEIRDQFLPEPVDERPKDVTPKDVTSKPKKSSGKTDFPIPETSTFPGRMILSILERKLEYGHNTFLFDGSKSTRFDKLQNSGVKNESTETYIPSVIAQLEAIGWEVESIIPEQSSVVILMRLESATLGIAYAVVDGKTAISYLVVAKERFKKNTYDKIFDVK